MSMPFYVSPEQLMKDRADFARKGIARGRSVAVVQYSDGIVFVSENPSAALHKISEIYDRIAFAAVGRYNEFENLRIAGVRLADMRGYSYDRRDVTGRGLANAYAQTLGAIFSSGGEKPYEVEIFVAEVGDGPADDQIYRLTYDGQVADEHDVAAMGGSAEVVAKHLREHYREAMSLQEAVRLAAEALGQSESGGPRTIPVGDLEVATLDRTRQQQRKFKRLTDSQVEAILGDRAVPGIRGPGEVADPTGLADTSSNPPRAYERDASQGRPEQGRPEQGRPEQGRREPSSGGSEPPVAPPVEPGADPGDPLT